MIVDPHEAVNEAYSFFFKIVNAHRAGKLQGEEERRWRELFVGLTHHQLVPLAAQHHVDARALVLFEEGITADTIREVERFLRQLELAVNATATTGGPSQEKALTQADFAKLCGVNKSTVTRWIKENVISHPLTSAKAARLKRGGGAPEAEADTEIEWTCIRCREHHVMSAEDARHGCPDCRGKLTTT